VTRRHVCTASAGRCGRRGRARSWRGPGDPPAACYPLESLQWLSWPAAGGPRPGAVACALSKTAILPAGAVTALVLGSTGPAVMQARPPVRTVMVLSDAAAGLRHLPGFGASVPPVEDLRPWLANPLGTDAHRRACRWSSSRIGAARAKGQVIQSAGWIAAAISHIACSWLASGVCPQAWVSSLRPGPARALRERPVAGGCVYPGGG